MRLGKDEKNPKKDRQQRIDTCSPSARLVTTAEDLQERSVVTAMAQDNFQTHHQSQTQIQKKIPEL